MQKYEYMGIYSGMSIVTVVHPSGEPEKLRVKDYSGGDFDLTISLCNKYAKEGWRVISGGGGMPLYVILERSIKEQ